MIVFKSKEFLFVAHLDQVQVSLLDFWLTPSSHVICYEVSIQRPSLRLILQESSDSFISYQGLTSSQ
jgi:hypothetical protein